MRTVRSDGAEQVFYPGFVHVVENDLGSSDREVRPNGLVVGLLEPRERSSPGRPQCFGVTPLLDFGFRRRRIEEDK